MRSTSRPSAPVRFGSLEVLPLATPGGYGTGRTDFPGGSADDLYHSVHEVLYRLPPETRVFVGDDYLPGGRAPAHQSNDRFLMLIDNISLPLLGGALIGLSATLLLCSHGRIAGISGIASGLVNPWVSRSEHLFRFWFLGGLVMAGVIGFWLLPSQFGVGPQAATPVIALAGLLVGFGSRLGSGCTSGHGVCGISRGSARSLVATATFLTTGALTVALVHWLAGGSS